MKKRQLLSLALGSIIMTSASLVHALDLFRPPMDEDDLEIKITNNPNVLVAALLGKDSRIKVVPGSVKFIGTAKQSATYTGFNLEPLPDRGFDSSYSRRLLASPRKAERITILDGILLTTGTAEGVNSLNSSVNFNSIPKPKTGSNSLLEALIGAKTYDQNVLSFQFTTTVSSVNGVSADFVFGSEEYPVFTGGYPVFSSSIFDVFGFFLDGKNCAVYSDGSLVSAALRDDFIDNSANVRYGNSYRLEYNGLIPSQHVECEFVDKNRTVHTLTIAIADTGGSEWDSGVFIGNLQGVSGQVINGIKPK